MTAASSIDPLMKILSPFPDNATETAAVQQLTQWLKHASPPIPRGVQKKLKKAERPSGPNRDYEPELTSQEKQEAYQTLRKKLVPARDALLAAQQAAFLVTLTATGFSNCNVSGAVEPDPAASVNILDALIIAQIAAGLAPTFACC